EVALVAHALAAGRHLGALLLRVVDEGFDGIDPARVGEGSHAGVRVEAVAHLRVAGNVRKLANELVVDLIVHEEAGWRDAHLAGVAVLHGAHHLGNALRIDVLEDEARANGPQAPWSRASCGWPPGR